MAPRMILDEAPETEHLHLGLRLRVPAKQNYL
jgi:hypothetical protein